MKTLIKGVRVVDRNHDGDQLDILVDGETIAEVAPEITAQADQVIDLAGYTMIPGVVDAHVHVAGGITDNYPAPELLEAWAKRGVCMVRDLGLLVDMSAEDFAAWRAQYTGPEYTRLLSCAKYIDAPEGYGHTHPTAGVIGYPCTVPAEGEAAVDALHSLGFEGLKLAMDEKRPKRLDPATLKAVCDRARSYGMWVGAHVYASDLLRILVDGGITDAAHCPTDEIPEDLLREMAEKGIPIVFTGDGQELPEGRPKPKLPPGMTFPPMGPGGPGGPGGPDGGPPPGPESPEAMAQAGKNLMRFLKLGGTVALGTDYMTQFQPAIPTPTMAFFCQSGMTVQQAVTAATYGGAAVCLKSDTMGTIEPGKEANLVGCAGVLDESFRALERPEFVMNRGLRLL